MNVILIEPEEAASSHDGLLVLGGRRAEHLHAVHRARVGDSVKIGVVGGGLGVATVESVEPTRATLRLGVCDRSPPEALNLTVCVALPRPPTVQKVLTQLTAFGVKTFVFFHSKRVEKSFWQSRGLTAEALGRQLRLGLEQGRDTALPNVALYRGFRAFVEEGLPGLMARHDRYLFGHVGASTPCPGDGRGGLVVIGPEGGWIEYEVERLEAAGLKAIAIGDRPLRVETACVAATARLGVGC